MKKQHWWKTVFKKAYLDAFNEIYSAKQGEKEVAFLVRALEMKKGIHILDLGCGQGRHTIPLAQLGMKVTGVDYSVFLLRAARQQTQIEKVDASFIRDDMRIYCDTEKYDVVIVLGNSFGYFNDNDNKQVLSNVATSLKDGGWLVLDLPNTPGMFRRRVTGRWTQRIPSGKLTTRMFNFNPETFQVMIQWHILQHQRKISFDGMLRLYTPPEINHLLIERNLVIKRTYGSFTNEPYSIKTRRYLVMARKVSAGES